MNLRTILIIGLLTVPALSSAQNAVLAHGVDAVDLSGGCEAAQAKGVAWIESLPAVSASSICMSAKRAIELGEMQIRIAKQCQGTPNVDQFLAQGVELRDQAMQTVRDSCV